MCGNIDTLTRHSYLFNSQVLHQHHVWHTNQTHKIILSHSANDSHMLAHFVCHCVLLVPCVVTLHVWQYGHTIPYCTHVMYETHIQLAVSSAPCGCTCCVHMTNDSHVLVHFVCHCVSLISCIATLFVQAWCMKCVPVTNCVPSCFISPMCGNTLCMAIWTPHFMCSHIAILSQ